MTPQPYLSFLKSDMMYKLKEYGIPYKHRDKLCKAIKAAMEVQYETTVATIVSIHAKQEYELSAMMSILNPQKTLEASEKAMRGSQ